jgi:ATP-dependent protease ClpP protease subunit
MKKIAIAGGIGWDFDGEMMHEALDGETGDIELSINSPGGDIYEGIDISNQIRKYRTETGGKVTVYYSGLVASAATVIAAAADWRITYDNSVFMIHNAMMGVIGDSRVMAFWADDLKRTDKVIIRSYAKLTGMSDEEIQALMDNGPDNAGTYFYGDEIKAAGFADEIIATDDDETKENKISESKIMFRNFINKAKPVEHDHERVVAMLKVAEKVNNLGAVKDQDSNNKRGEVMKKNEILDQLKTFKANGEISLPEIAKSLGLGDMLITDEQKSHLAQLKSVKEMTGGKEPVAFVKEIIEERKANAVSVREAKMSELFGAKEIKETGKKNLAREAAELVVGARELSEDVVAEVKANAIYQQYQGEVADPASKMNQFGVSHENDVSAIGGAVEV